MKSEWDCVLQNLGEWQGSFTSFSPQGELIQDIPSLILLEGVNQNQSIHLVLKRFYPVPESAELQPRELVMDFSAPAAGAFFFETGAFSDGRTSFSSHQPFVAEFCLLDGDPNRDRSATSRLRQVLIFDAENQLQQVTLIREHRSDLPTPERSPLRVENLLGTWQGKAVTRYPRQATADIADITTTWVRPSEHRPSNPQLIQQVLGYEAIDITLSQGNLCFDQEGQSYQTLLLPDGASSTYPVQICPRQPFFLEAGWLLAPGVRQRLIRRYNSEGDWISVTWISEYQVR
ncbi:MAG: DUF3598 family protein [Oscillatoriophycideae cyanobacterium NC_groundwater_1537_Pr4_S-0.65um_50_18]|nr:DUF3598 family protein [Oscillatoriophycideae cyanobacterium NC_groundwater_1537_Pr4_S-0.65um_50_18]